MGLDTIFARDSHVCDCWVNVVHNPRSGKTYYAHMADSRELTEYCRQAVEYDSEVKVLYRVRVKYDQTFPIIGRKRRQWSKRHK